MQLRFIMRTVTIALFFAVGFTLLAGSNAHSSSEAPKTERPGFALRGFDGGTIELEARRGKPLTAVIFFATWSPRSHQALVDIGLLREKYAEKGFDVIMVCAETEVFPPGFDDMLFDYLEGTNADVPVAMDEGLATYRAWEVKAQPSTYFLDKDLRQINFIGSAPSSYKMMVAEIIEEALGLTPKEDEASKAPTRYQAAKPQMLGYGMAHKLAQRGKSKKAKKKVEEVIAADPKFPDAHALLGMILLHGKQIDAEAAKASFDKALEADPNLPIALLGRAHFTLQGGDTAKAVATIREALAKNAWGFMHKPKEAKLKEIETKLAGVAGGKAPEANTEEAAKPAEAKAEGAEKPTEAKAEAAAPADAKALIQEVLDDFLVLKKKTKVNRSIMKKK
jgi:hypothetical protein